MISKITVLFLLIFTARPTRIFGCSYLFNQNFSQDSTLRFAEFLLKSSLFQRHVLTVYAMESVLHEFSLNTFDERFVPVGYVDTKSMEIARMLLRQIGFSDFGNLMPYLSSEHRVGKFKFERTFKVRELMYYRKLGIKSPSIAFFAKISNNDEFFVELDILLKEVFTTLEEFVFFTNGVSDFLKENHQDGQDWRQPMADALKLIFPYIARYDLQFKRGLFGVKVKKTSDEIIAEIRESFKPKNLLVSESAPKAEIPLTIRFEEIKDIVPNPEQKFKELDSKVDRLVDKYLQLSGKLSKDLEESLNNWHRLQESIKSLNREGIVEGLVKTKEVLRSSKSKFEMHLEKIEFYIQFAEELIKKVDEIVSSIENYQAQTTSTVRLKEDFERLKIILQSIKLKLENFRAQTDAVITEHRNLNAIITSYLATEDQNILNGLLQESIE